MGLKDFMQKKSCKSQMKSDDGDYDSVEEYARKEGCKWDPDD